MFGKVELALLRDPRVARNEMCVYVAAVSFSRQDERVCFPSVPALAERARLSVRATQAALRKGTELGLWELVAAQRPDNDGRASNYLVLRDLGGGFEALDAVTSQNASPAPPPRRRCTTLVQEVHPEGETGEAEPGEAEVVHAPGGACPRSSDKLEEHAACGARADACAADEPTAKIDEPNRESHAVEADTSPAASQENDKDATRTEWVITRDDGARLVLHLPRGFSDGRPRRQDIGTLVSCLLAAWKAGGGSADGVGEVAGPELRRLRENGASREELVATVVDWLKTGTVVFSATEVLPKIDFTGLDPADAADVSFAVTRAVELEVGGPFGGPLSPQTETLIDGMLANGEHPQAVANAAVKLERGGLNHWAPAA